MVNQFPADESYFVFLDTLAKATRPLAEVSEVMVLTAELLGRRLSCSRCAYALVEEDQDRFEVLGDYNDGVGSIVGRLAFSAFGPEVLRLMRADEPYINFDIDADPRTAQADVSAYRSASIQSVICVPLHKQGRFVAAMAVHQSTARVWTEDEVALVRHVVSRCWDALERMRSDQALRAAHEQLRLALSAGELGTWQWLRATDAVVLDERAAAMFGVTPNMPLTGEELREKIVGGSPDDLFRFEPERLYQAEHLVRSHRAPRWLAVRGKAKAGPDGMTHSMSGVVQDITDSRSSQLRLRESETRFRTLAQTMPNQAWTATPDGLLDWLNEPTLEYSGLTLPELTGNGWTRIVHADDLAAAAASWADALARGEAYETVFRLQRADGEHRWHLARAAPVRNERGDIVSWIGTNTDIEEERRAGAALERLNSGLNERIEERTKERDRLWEVSQDLLITIGPDERYRDVNPAFFRVLGYAPEEIIGAPADSHILPEDVAPSREALARAQAVGLTRFENRYRHRDGRIVWLSWNASPDEHGVVYANGRDITAEKEARGKLVAAEQALRQAQKMEAVGTLTSGIAHDFNNLLQSMLTALNIVRGRVLLGTTENVLRCVDLALGSVHRASALTHRLLAFSRQQPLDPHAIRPDELVATMMDLFRRSIGPSISLTCEAAESLWAARCDSNQLENALLNLVVNARDAMPNGGRVSISFSNESVAAAGEHPTRAARSGEYVRIRVADDGSGMSSDVLEHVFEPFFTTKPLGQGTGLGLAMVHGFVEQSGGFVQVKSTLEVGTTFDVFLPRATRSSEPVLEAPSTEVLVAGRSGTGRVVQLIEDEPTLNALTAEALEAAGFKVYRAHDGPSGLAALFQHSDVELLVTDVGLPGLNGRQVADAARLTYPALPVLLITGYADKEIIRGAGLPERMRVLAKPFANEALLAAVHSLLAGAP